MKALRCADRVFAGWLYRVEGSLKPGEPCRRYLHPRAVCLLLVVLTACFLLSCVLTLAARDRALSFRASHTVNGMGAAIALRRRVRGSLESLLQHHPEECGVAAPAVREYSQYALMRRGGDLLQLFNPRLRVLPEAHPVNLHETSLMCPEEHEQNRPVARTRAEAVTLTWESLEDHFETKTLQLQGTEAICAQILVSVLQGQWPCALPKYTQKGSETEPEAEPGMWSNVQQHIPRWLGGHKDVNCDEL